MQRKIETRLVLKKRVKIFTSKVMLTVIIILFGLILTKNNPQMKTKIKEEVFEKSFKFQNLKNIYEKYFGKLLSGEKLTSNLKPVFQEKLFFDKIEEYNNGVKLHVKEDCLIPVLESGVVIYIGEKETMGYTVTVEQVNGIDTSYSNIKTNNLKLYDYIEKGDLIGSAKGGKFFLQFQKNGEYLDYKDFI